MKRDIVITWPKTKPLADYLAELASAYREDLWINYRVAKAPFWPGTIYDHGMTSWAFGVERPRCFMVHDGAIRGWVSVVGVCRREKGEVKDWPEGLYLVRDPVWHPVDPVPMKGFQGWRWWYE